MTARGRLSDANFAADLPPIGAAAHLPVALGAVAAAVASAMLTPEEGQAIATVLEMQRRAIETVELEQRIAALEVQGDGRRP